MLGLAQSNTSSTAVVDPPFAMMAMLTCPHCSTSLEADAAFCGGCGHALGVQVRKANLVGTILDRRYQIVAKLAAGGFGAVYRAIDLADGSQIALKVLHAELALDPCLAARFQREADILAQLNGPGTVALRDAGCAKDGTLYIALELLHGEGLDERLHREGMLPWRQVLALVRDACDALAEAHAIGVVHRDLKPANLFLARSFADLSERVTVIDFGVAKQQDGAAITSDGAELTRVGQAIGTLDYMAPEQLVGIACDARTDLYTLGVVAYECITGRRPFADATTATSLFTALLTLTPDAPSLLADVPEEIDALLLRCLERDPDDRFSTVAALANAIDDVLDAEMVDSTDVIDTIDVIDLGDAGRPHVPLAA
jgi:serine/threonine-protein kinase